MDEESDTVERNESTPEKIENSIANVAKGTDSVMELLEMLTAVLMVILFAIGVYDMGLRLYKLGITGNYTDPNAVVEIIDTALLLLIIVEVYRTVVAYLEDLRILPLVINVAIIAMARKIISFRTGKYPGYEDALIAAMSYGVLLVILIGAFYYIHKGQEITDFDVYSEPFSTEKEREETADIKSE
jgi:uncharacterized membrane protein (DUF373 family)